MKKICRLSIPYNADPDKGESAKMSAELHAAFDATGTKRADIMTAYRSEGRVQETHWGNWVLTPVADNEAVEKIAQFFQRISPRPDGYIDMRREVIERQDIVELAKHIGKKVSMNATGWLCNTFRQIGTIIAVDLDKPLATITIRKFRSKKHGWIIEENQDAMVRLI